jgi:hypothetical protein
VFERDPVAHDTWRLVQRLVASNATVSDAFGVSVALHDETIVVGASSADNPGLANYGSAYVFERRPKTGVWSEVATLIASDPSGVVAFGSSVAIRADRILVGAPESDHSSQVFAAGFAYLFHRNHGGVGVWGEALKLAAGSPASLNRFGQSVGLSGDLALIGEYKGDPPGLSNAGLSHLFTLSFATETYCTAGTSANGCLAVLSAAGSASATAGSGFVLTATAVEGERDGMFFLGARGRQASPWGNGTSLTCVIPPVRGAGLLLGTGTPGTCEGCFAQDLNALWCAVCPRPLHLSPGGLLQAQLAYRDPQNTSNRSTSLSNAIEFQMGP